MIRPVVLGVVASLALTFTVRTDVRAGVPQTNNMKPDVLLTAMQDELKRASDSLGKMDPAPYFISFSVHDQDSAVAIGLEGGLANSTHARTRVADVVMRVGTPELDNSHGENRRSAISTATLPLDDDPDAISRVFWRLTYGEYRKASQAYLNVKTRTQVNAKEEDTSADFSKESPQTHLTSKPVPASQDQKALEELAKRLSGQVRKYPHVYSSMVMVSRENSRWHFASTEGTKLVTDGGVVRLVIQAETRADDGMDLLRIETFQAETLAGLPKEAELTAKIDKMATDLEKLRVAPVAEPYDGPALLSGRASAVFFHEVLGHRLEGHRQRGEQEGQTFTKKINQEVLPAFISVADDPTMRTLNGQDLSGYYEYDEEGIPAKRVEVVQNGVLKNFLMSRMPIANFAQSNGHGRGQPGLMATGRQGNLIITSTKSVKDKELREMLIEEVKKQGKPYGLYFEDIQGGFTLTQRAAPQAFQVLPVLVWRVYPDGRPDELVRGVDIVGTPIAAMNRIAVTGEKVETFNGVCGAESGGVPVAAAAPAILFTEMEVQKRPHSLTRPPILPPPGSEVTQTNDTQKRGGQQ